MPTINIFNPGTVGVDMKSNPLFLKNEKVHSAVNLGWEEGRCFTRPGFRYHALGFSGQVQGACLFTPALGISARPFALPLAGLVTVVGGQVRVNDTTGGIITCNPVTVNCGDGFAGRGEVNVFGAENFLIIQNRRSNTYWWSGNGPATESRGMDSDTYWTDDEVPAIRFTPEMPEADVPECDKFPCDGDRCTLEISDIVVTSTTTATFKITNSGVAAATVTGFLATPPTGVSFDPAELTIEAGTDEEVTVTSASHDLEVLGLDVEAVNSCGTVEFNIAPTNPPEPDCVLEVTSVSTGPSTGTITLTNNGLSTLTGILIDPAGGNEWGYNPILPISIAGGGSVEVLVNAVDAEVYGVPFDVITNCGTFSSEMPVPAVDCAIGITACVGGVGEDGQQSGSFTITNSGLTEIEVTGMSIEGFESATFDPFLPHDEFPFIVLPGTNAVGTFLITGLEGGGGASGADIHVENSCTGDASAAITNC